MLGLALAVLLLWVGGAQAKREQAYAYPFSRVWTAAVRMLRVDFESPITEKDKDSGYFLFDYPDSGKNLPGSVEVVRVVQNGVESVRVVITVSAMPTYVEQMMLDRLARKLGEDFGDPETAKEAKPGTPPQPNAPASGVAPKPPADGDKAAAAPKK
jgi:hypothetical protein